MPPTVLVARSAAAQLFAEVRRWVEAGLRAGGQPFESLLYPLSALIPAGRCLTPLELVQLDDLQELVISAVAIPPDESKAFSPANCHFAAADLEGVNRTFNAQIDEELRRCPRLGVHSKLHSHPFPGGAFLSGGDLHHGVTSDAAVRWRSDRGLASAILHVVHPDGPPCPAAAWRIAPEGAVAVGGGRTTRWRIRSWGSREAGELAELGDARVVADRHPSVRAARRPPYWRTPAGRRWCDEQKAGLRADGLEVSRNLLGRGWRRYLLARGGRQLLIALPPDLPLTPPRLLEVQSAWANQFAPLPLPSWWRRVRGLRDLSLIEMARHYLGPSSPTRGRPTPGRSGSGTRSRRSAPGPS